MVLHSELLTPNGSRKTSKNPAPMGAGRQKSREGRFSQIGRIKTMGRFGWPEKVGLIQVGLKVVSFPKPLPFSIDDPS